MVVRFGDRRRPPLTNSPLIKRGGDLPCKRCGFYYPQRSAQVKYIDGNFCLCVPCFDSETDGK